MINMDELFGMKLYYTDVLPYGYFIIYMPLVFLVLWIIYKLILKRIPVVSVRWVSSIVFLFVLLGLPWWDVYRISNEANKVCKEQGGLHIYKTLEAEGFLGGWGIEMASQYGFSFVESGGGKHMNRWTMVNGEPVRESITEFKSKYQVQIGADRRKISNIFKRSSSLVIDRKTKEVLGELVTIAIRSTLLDAIFLSSVGGSVKGWRCGDEAPGQERYFDKFNKRYRYTFSDLIKETLKPKLQNKGEE